MASQRSRPAKANSIEPDLRSTRAAGSASAAFAVVGIGASAGGLDACRKLFAALPADNGMAFILVQHLDPNHESLLVELLAGNTSMTVQHAADGMPIERDHLYVIPPGKYLSVQGGILRLSQPQARHGARLPVDFLLRSLAEDMGARAVCVILSGTGADGSLGLVAVKEKGGMVIVQDPDEADHDGMPQAAILTGAVDLVLPAAEIPAALVKYGRRLARARKTDGADSPDQVDIGLRRIIDLLRAKTPYDFTPYKPGTLVRRIERRMALAGVEINAMDRYLEILMRDEAERDLLAKDLLINVTRFFRDPAAFEFLAQKIIPELVAAQSTDQPLRIWIVGCSTGEETYSLAMVFHEQIVAVKKNIKLQVFATDVDPDAVAGAREGIYPESIEADVSSARIARYFTKTDRGYRITPQLREMVIFAVQDVLADPPFSRLDFISCRNLLIYLRPESQEKIISLFHFALRPGGILLLGSSEAVSEIDDHFEVISKSARLYRHIGRRQPGELGFSMGAGAGIRAFSPAQQEQPKVRQEELADLCRRLAMESHGLAVVLINRRNEAIYSLGPIDRYLRPAIGRSTQDVLAMAREGVRTKLRSAIHRAIQEKAHISIAGGQMDRDGHRVSINIDVQPAMNEGEELLLVSFTEETEHDRLPDRAVPQNDISRVEELERELKATKVELESAIHNLEISSEEQKAINEEALSINEEFQSTNEELVTSKEELQSLNEELTALNSQLQETLDHQRTLSNDLQNVLFSTDVATLFLDSRMNIRFFTPTVKTLFHAISSDIGRPLADLSPLATDDALLADARKVLQTTTPIEREVEVPGARRWYIRRILPYRTQDNTVEGVVITYNDVTEQQVATAAVEEAKLQAEQANVAKSRFLAAASHDLRQPLQTIALIHGLLEKIVDDDKAHELIARLDEALGSMSGMLNSLLDINQIEAGGVIPEMVRFPVNDLLFRLRDEFAYHAASKGIELRVVPCGLAIETDPRLLEQMIRNLLSNAVKYTNKGKVLLGCRRAAGILRIEVWDTGLGISDEQHEAIFDEYYQVHNPERDRNRGLGLGLSIVKMLGDLLGHSLRIRSRPEAGSAFVIEIKRSEVDDRARPMFYQAPRSAADVAAEVRTRSAAILIVEDNLEVREFLDLMLKGEGHNTATARDSAAALELVKHGNFRPDLILSDFHLPHRSNGLELIMTLRAQLHRDVPAIILSGGLPSETLRDIVSKNCVYFHKPVRPAELRQMIERLLSAATAANPQIAVRSTPGENGGLPVIYVVEDDDQVRDGLCEALLQSGFPVEDFATCEAFLDEFRPECEACLLIDAYLPGMQGLELLGKLREAGHRVPAVIITGGQDISLAIKAMKAGASDFIMKPVSRDGLLTSIKGAIEIAADDTKRTTAQADAARRVACLTPRQREIMELVLAGHPSKNIAADLGINQRTVENHRAAIMKRTGSKSLPALARLAIAAGMLESE